MQAALAVWDWAEASAAIVFDAAMSITLKEKLDVIVGGRAPAWCHGNPL